MGEIFARGVPLYAKTTKYPDIGWVRGSIIHDDESHSMYIVELIKVGDLFVTTNLIPVHNHSVGKKAGITDKMAHDIYENDIIQIELAHATVEGLVIFKSGSFGVFSKGHFTTFVDILSLSRDILILGNIYDNPNLYKEEYNFI